MNVLKTRVKSFLLKLQCYGDFNNWTVVNRCIDIYINSIKCDPYVSSGSTAPQIDTKLSKNNKIIKSSCIMPFIEHDKPLPCEFCSVINKPPYFQGSPVLETVDHVLTSCPMYHSLRLGLSENLKILIVRTDLLIISVSLILL